MGKTYPYQRSDTVRQIVECNWFNTKTGSKGQTYTGVTQTANFSGYELVNPDADTAWRFKVARGIDATNPYFRSGIEVFPATAVTEDLLVRSPVLGNISSTSRLLCGTGGTFQPDSSDDFILQDQALGKLKNRLTSRLSTSQVLAPALELHELNRLLGGLGGISQIFMRQWLNLLSKKHPRKRVVSPSLLREASALWLGYNFGIRPLVNDIGEIGLSLAAFYSRSGKHRRVYGTSEKKWVTSLAPVSNGTTNGNWVFNKRHTHVLSYKYIAGIDLSFYTSNNYSLMQHIGLGLKDLPRTAWELLPFSWIADYFTTIGSFLDDTISVPSGSTKYIVLNKRYTCDVDITVGWVPIGATRLVSHVASPGQINYWSFSRSKLAGLPHAALRFKTEAEIGKNWVAKITNLAAVMAVRARKFLPF